RLPLAYALPSGRGDSADRARAGAELERGAARGPVDGATGRLPARASAERGDASSPGWDSPAARADRAGGAAGGGAARRDRVPGFQAGAAASQSGHRGPK